MRRSFTTFGVLVLLAAWAGAQGRPPISTADQLKMLQADRALINNLLDDGLGLAKSNTSVDKADGCRRMSRTLVDALGRAVGEQDPDRVAELSTHLESVVRDALAPSLDEARGLIPDDSPEAAKLKLVRQKSSDDLNAAIASIPDAGKVGTSARVKDAREKLSLLRDRLK